MPQKVNSLTIAFIGSILLWIACFWQFISGKLALTSDAISYYNHIKFFIDNLAQGVYPLWDPYWHYGSANEFFLRRMGSFNPFLLTILLFVKLGIGFLTSYMIFSISYFFLGCFGFYVLSYQLFKDKIIAFVAYLLMAFSMMGTRIFDSFMILEFVPIVWFFAFLLLFFDGKKRLGLIGMVFTAIILFTTYIPFYFLNIVVQFLICFLIFYPGKCVTHLKEFVVYVLSRKILSLFLIGVLLCSLIPGIRLYLDSSNGEFVLSKRNTSVQTENVIEVGKKKITEWGIEEDLFFSYSFRDLKKFKLSLFYVPVFFYLLGALGILTQLNRRLVFFFLFFFSILIVFSPFTPMYHFLYKHIFYFKYFRNLHFYLWWAMLPVAILFVCEIMRLMLANWEKGQKLVSKIFILLIHGAAWYVAQEYHYGLISTNCVIILSALLFMFYRSIPKKETVLPIIFFVVITLQPIEVFSVINRNSEPKKGSFQYDQIDPEFQYTRGNLKGISKDQIKERKYGRTLHYANAYYDKIRKKINHAHLYNYLYYKFVLYDRKPDNNPIHFKNFNGIEGASDEFNVERFNANTVTVNTDFKKDQYLVYNDNYDSSWRATIDDKEANLELVNQAFKGIHVPSGKHKIIFKYGTSVDYSVNILLIVIFYGTCLMLFNETIRLRHEKY